MSLLSRERLVINLAPGRLGVQRFARRGGPLDQHAVTFHSEGPASWTGGIEALERLLNDAAWRGREMTVLLSSHYVRHALLPRGEALGMAERQGLARLVFRKLYGDLAADWAIRASPAGRRPTIACGVPQALLAALDTACEARGTLISIQPVLMAVFNGSRQSMREGNGLLAIVEPGRITLAGMADGDWRSVSSRAAEGRDLPGLLAEECALAGLPAAGSLWLYDPGGQAAVPEGGGWRIERLPAGAGGLP